MRKNWSLYMLVFFLMLAFLLTACGGSGGTSISATATPKSTIDQPGTGSKGLPLYCPLSVAIDSQDALYVSDNDNSAVHERIIKLSTTEQKLAEWHLFAPGDIGRAQGPGSIAIDAQGNMYVADLGNNKILKVSPGGKILTSWGSFGSGSGQFEEIDAIAVDANDTVYVGDNEHSSMRIEKFSNTGTFLGIALTQTKPHGSIGFTDFNPIGLAIDSGNNLFVANSTFITKLSSTGQILDKLQFVADSPTSHILRMWAGLSLNARGSFYAVQLTVIGDTNYPVIMKIDLTTGKSVAVLNVWKSGIVEVKSIAVDSQGNLYATEETKTTALQLQKFSPTGESLAIWNGTCSSS